MRMDRQGGGDGPLVRGIGPGGFRVDDGVYPALLLTQARAESWAPPALDMLDVEALSSILSGDPVPEFLLLGTGASLRQPSRALVAALDAKGMGVEAMDSRAAARAWGVLRAEGRQVVAALYPLA